MGTERTKKLLLIDGNNLFYRAYYSHGKISSYNGINISAIYGGLNIISAALRKFTIDEVIICWDGSRNKHRLALWPEYKEGREKKLPSELEDMNTQKGQFRELAHYLGIKQIINPDHEADDLIYKVTRLKKKSKPIIILSTDKDFDQLVSEKVYIWNDKLGKMITPKNIKQLKGYKASQCVDYLSLVGDSGDNIPGYRGIGEKTALKILAEHNTASEYLRYIMVEKDGMHGKIIGPELRKVLDRNRPMIDLRFFYKEHLKGKLKLRYYKGKSIGLKESSYISLAASLGLRKFRENTFIQLFRRLK